MRWIVVAILTLSACGSSSSSAKDNAMSSFKLVPANNASAAPINVEINTPGWKARTSPNGQTTFDVPGLDRPSRVTLTALELPGSPADQMAAAIDAQGIGDGKRADLPNGRVWIQKKTEMTEARIFVPYGGGVVMGVAFLEDDSKLPEIRKAFETITVAR